MYAVIRSGGKQYRVAPGDVIRLEKLDHGQGSVQFDDVLGVAGEQGFSKPQSQARVTGEVIDDGRHDKIIVFHYKRKKQYKKLRGHRQPFTAVRITEIAYDGQTFSAPELAKRQPKVKKAAAADESETKSARPAKKKAGTKKAVARKTTKKK
jgi:large subunit ribosomal protein L21